ncbi:MAG: response regulator [Elusimicrobia bacterium]|nr:response regulator [Elusimicrobiota bacterium]
MPKKILIADDERSIHRLIQRTLQDASYDLVSAYDGLQAIQLATEEKPDLILLDIHMPRMSGGEVIQALHKDIQLQMIPVILISVDATPMDKCLGFESGADDYIAKPFEILELRARIKSMLNRTQRKLFANPLTLLPGNPSIEEEVNHRLRENIPFAFLYSDIDHFKAYNDAYGYLAGDQVIKKTSELLMEILKNSNEPDDFLGHIGGDDFVLLTDPGSSERTARQIAQTFDQQSPSFYRPADQMRGCISTFDRLGQKREIPLMTLSMAIVDSQRRKLGHYAQWVDVATQVKRHLKSRETFERSVYMQDRRRDHS